MTELSVAKLRKLLQATDTASYAAYQLGEVAVREGTALRGLARQGVLSDLLPLLRDDPCTEATYYALKALFDALRREAKEVEVLAEDPSCLPAFLAVLRSGPSAYTGPCQHLSAALIWSTAANSHAVSQLAGCDGVVSTLLNVLSEVSDSGIQAAVSGALAHLVGCGPVCLELATLPSVLPTLATFLCALSSSSKKQQLEAAQRSSTEDSIYMRIHGMQILSSTLETAAVSGSMAPPGKGERKKWLKALSHILLWLLSQDAVPQTSSTASCTRLTLLFQQLKAMYERCLAAVVSAVESEPAAISLLSSLPVAASAARLLTRELQLWADEAEAMHGATTAERMSLGLCCTHLRLVAYLAGESSNCRLNIGRETGFVSTLLKFISISGGDDARAETVAAAVRVLSKLSKEAKFGGKIVRGGGKGKHTREPAMRIIARLVAACQGERTHHALTSAVGEYLLEMFRGDWWIDAVDSAEDIHREFSSVVAWLMENKGDKTAGQLPDLVSQMLLKFSSRQLTCAGEDWRHPWEFCMHSAVKLMAGETGHCGSVVLAHSLRRAAALGGPEAALAIASNRELQRAVTTAMEHGSSAISKMFTSRNRCLGELPPVDPTVLLAIEAAEAEALLIASLADAHRETARTLALDSMLASALTSVLAQAEVATQLEGDLQAAAGGACAAAAGALAALFRGPGSKELVEMAAAMLTDYNLLKCLCLLLTKLPVAHPSGQRGSSLGGARGGAEHVAELLEAIAFSGDNESIEVVAEALMDCAGALEALVAILPQPPLAKGAIQPDADWRNGVVPSPEQFGSSGMAVLRLLYKLAMSPYVAQVMADEVELFPPLLWACLTQGSDGAGSANQYPADAENGTVVTSAAETQPMSASSLAIAIVQLVISTLEVSDQQDALSVPFVIDALLCALESNDKTASASAVLAVSSLAGLAAFQALLIVQQQNTRMNMALNRMELGAPIPSLPNVAPSFSRYGVALVKTMIGQLGMPSGSDDRCVFEAEESEAIAMTPAAYAASVALHKRLHVAWAITQLTSERKLCRAFAMSEEMVAKLVEALSSAGGGGLVAACTPAPGGNDSSSSAISREELCTMAQLVNSLAQMSLISIEAGNAVARGPRMVEGLVRILQGGCLLPARRPGDPSVLEDGTPELEHRQEAVLTMRISATRLLGALAQCMVDAIRSKELALQTEGEGKESRYPADKDEVPSEHQESHGPIKSGLEAYTSVLVETCVKLAAQAKEPMLQAGALYALSCLVAASPGMANICGSTPGSAECCLKAMLAAGERQIDPGKVNAVVLSASAATKILWITCRAGSRSMKEQLADDKRLGKACAIMLEECSYVRLRNLFPNLLEATVAAAMEGENSLSDRKKGNRGAVTRRNSRGLSFSGSIMGSVRSAVMQNSGLGSSLLDSSEFDAEERKAVEVKDVRLVVAEMIANVAAIDGVGTKGLLLPKPVLQPLRGLLKMSDKHAAKVASSALWALTTTDKGAEVVGDEKLQIVPILVGLLTNKRFPVAQANAAGCLASLARLECNIEQISTMEGCLPGLVALMKSAAQALEDIAQAPPRIGGWQNSVEESGRDPKVLEQQLSSAAAAIATMSMSGPVAARIASTAGLTQGLAMSLRCQAEKVQLYAAGAVGNLANFTSSLTVLASARGLVRAVVRLAQHGKSPQVVKNAAGAIRNLASSERGREELVREAAVIQTLLALVGKDDGNGGDTHLEAQLKAAGALGNLSGDRNGLEAIAKDAEVYVKSLLKLLVSRQVDKRLGRYVLVALSNGASHPAIASAMLESPTLVSVFAGNFLACKPRRCSRGCQSTNSSLRQSNTDDSEASFMAGPSNPQAGKMAGVKCAVSEVAITRNAGFIAEACYLEALRQLAGASSGSEAHRGAARVLAAGGADLLEGLLEVLCQGASALVRLGCQGGVNDESFVGSELQFSPNSPNDVKDLFAAVSMAGASAGVFAQLLLEARQGDGGIESMAGAEVIKWLEDSCYDMVEPLLDLLEFEVLEEIAGGSEMDSALVQALFALWVLCVVPTTTGHQADGSQEHCAALLVARPMALQRMASFLRFGLTQEGQVKERGASMFDPARLFAGATLGHLAATGRVHGPLFEEVVAADAGALGKLLVDLLYCPHVCAVDSLQTGTGDVSQSPQQVEDERYTTAEASMATALGASLGKAGLHGANRATFVAGAAKSLGHLSSIPKAFAGVAFTVRHARRLSALLEIAVETSPSMAPMVEGVLTAFGGLSAYTPEARASLADLVEDDADFAKRLIALVDPRQPWVVQAYAATTVGNLASERPSIAPRLTQQACLSALARCLTTAAQEAFPTPSESVPKGVHSSKASIPDNVAFSAASVTGCLMNLSQCSIETATVMGASAAVVDALADVLRLATAVALRESDNEIALGCVAYSAATVGALLAASPETHTKLSEHSGIQAGLVDAVCVPQLDAQRVTLMALSSLVPTAAGQKSARLNFKNNSVGKSTEESVRLRDLIDGHPHLRDVLGELTGAEDPHIRQNAAWLLSI